MNFASDNVAGASPAIIEAIVAANAGPQAAYGVDDYTKRAETMLAELFEHEVAVFLVATGTAANALALGALAPPWGAVFCHEESHVIDDECGAPEFFTAGAKLVGIPGVGGKIAPEALQRTIARYPRGVVKASQPAALSIAQVTEAGTLYSIDEIAALATLARQHGLGVHLDGARFANALVALGATPAEMTWRCGVDVVSFGATKNGALACEAVVFFDATKAASLPFARKRGGHTLSKGRLLGAQMCAYLADGQWLALARHANAMAARLSQGLAALPGVRLAWPAEANEIFAIMPQRMNAALRAAGFHYHHWSTLSLDPAERIAEDECLVRLVTSFATCAEDVDRLVAEARGV
jgi:threonine aldolase